MNLTPGQVERIVRAKFPHAHRSGSEFRLPCPVHQGKRESFAISTETGQAFCHSQCGRGWDLVGLEQELSGAGFKEALEFLEAIAGTVATNGYKNGHTPGYSSTKREIDRTYDYVDEHGSLLFQAVRTRPKGFYQRRPDGKGGWLHNLKDTPLVLYRFPKIIFEKSILLAEGERDVESLEELGYAATCNPMGAGKWRDEYTDQLAGKRVYIFPDNDEPGRKHADKVARALHGKAAEVHVIAVRIGKDVTDWIQAGATRETIDLAIADAVQTAGAATSERVWRATLICSESGLPKPLLANALVAFRKAPDLQGILAFNEFSLRTRIRKRPPWQTSGLAERDWTSGDDVLAAEWLQRQGIYVSVEMASQAAESVAQEHQCHPVRDYLGSLNWDGKRRLDTWLATHFGVEYTPYSRAVGAKWLLSAVARIFRPGCKADCVPILEGPQGIGKSLSLKKLAGEWFSDEIAELGTKDASMGTSGTWVIELSELDSLSRAEARRIKAFVSRCVDRFRPPYGRRLIESPRQCVFVGTTNSESYLRDETGARRFWPLRCGRIDVDAIERDRDQLWAEARERFESGESWWLDSQDLQREAGEEQATRYQGDPWDELISGWITAGGRDDVSIAQVLELCLQKQPGQWTQPDANRVARCLRAAGWQRFQRRDENGREWRYRRPQ